MMRHTKKKRKSRKSRKRIVGGNPTVVTIEQILDYATNPDINYEVCGYVTETGVHYMEPQDAPQDTTRLNCTSSDKPTLWHTHPAISKYYPSYEDIRKLLKRNRTTKSIIYTRFGHWILENLDDKDADPFYIEHTYKTKINDILKTFYFDSGNGRTYNLDAINTLIDSLGKVLPEEYTIRFVPIP